MVTMLDVARKAGVSKSTVSRVLNGQNIVTEEVANAVRKAIEETGYRPNLLARQLSTQKTQFFGFVMSNTFFDGPYFSRLLSHAARFSEENNYQLIIADGKHSADDEIKAINFLLDMKCTGIIVYPQFLSAERLSEIMAQTAIPIIVLNRQCAQYPDRVVTVEYYQSAAMLMDYLLTRGHSNIAFISGNHLSMTARQRFDAYRDRLARNGIDYNPDYVAEGDWSLESGYKAVHTFLSRKIDYTAIFASNDEMALGAMKALQELGYRIPEDVSLVGFDNNNFSSYFSPALTTVQVPLEQMIQKGILMALGNDAQASAIDLECTLVERESVARINRRD